MFALPKQDFFACYFPSKMGISEQCASWWGIAWSEIGLMDRYDLSAITMVFERIYLITIMYRYFELTLGCVWWYGNTFPWTLSPSYCYFCSSSQRCPILRNSEGRCIHVDVGRKCEVRTSCQNIKVVPKVFSLNIHFWFKDYRRGFNLSQKQGSTGYYSVSGPLPPVPSIGKGNIDCWVKLFRDSIIMKNNSAINHRKHPFLTSEDISCGF